MKVLSVHSKDNCGARLLATEKDLFIENFVPFNGAKNQVNIQRAPKFRLCSSADVKLAKIYTDPDGSIYTIVVSKTEATVRFFLQDPEIPLTLWDEPFKITIPLDKPTQVEVSGTILTRGELLLVIANKKRPTYFKEVMVKKDKGRLSYTSVDNQISIEALTLQEIAVSNFGEIARANFIYKTGYAVTNTIKELTCLSLP